MFFAPPKVKSLSRYAEFGIYLGTKHFLLMLGIAITAHIALITIYSMRPREEVIRIPVHALNIKLSGGSFANGIHIGPGPAPAPVAAPATVTPVSANATKVEEMTVADESDAETAMEEALTQEEVTPAPVKKHTPPAATGKTVHKVLRRPASVSHNHATTTDGSMAKPKKYVRDLSVDAENKAKSGGKAAGSNAGAIGDAKGKEVIERYTQVITQSIKNHQAFAREAYRDAAQEQSSVKGQAVIRIRIDREGHIIKNMIERTSGNELVDQVAMAMVRASDPVPAAPSDYPSDNQLEFVFAIQVDFTRQ